jgi:uncharacterized protein HemX
MPTNNYEINSAYQTPEESATGGKKIFLIILLVALAIAGYYLYGNKKVEAPTETPTITATSTTTQVTSEEDAYFDELSASVSAAISSDDSDTKEIEKEFKK